jgi:hypothetical protein
MCAPLIHILVARNEHGHANLILATIKTTYIIKVTNMNMLIETRPIRTNMPDI